MNDADWLDAKQALHLVERLTFDRSAAKRTLAEHLRDGDLHAAAARTWISEAETIKKAWHASTEKIDLVDGDTPIPARYWQSSKRWSYDQEQWRWPRSRFSITIRSKPRRRRMFDGVKFAVSDINRILQRRTASKGGAPGKIIEWTSFWHEVIALSQSERLNESQFPTQASLRKELLAQINEGLSEKTVKPIVRQIYEKFVKN